MPLSIGESPMPQLGNRRAVTNRGEHVLQRLAGRIVIVHVVGRHERQALLSGHAHQRLQAQTIVGSAEKLGEQMAPVSEHFAITGQAICGCLGVVGLGKPDAGEQSVGELGHVGEGQPAGSFFRLAAPARNQLRQATVSRPIGCEQHDGRRIDGSDFRPDEQFQADLFGRDMRADDAGQAVQIGDGQRANAQLGRPLH